MIDNKIKVSLLALADDLEAGKLSPTSAAIIIYSIIKPAKVTPEDMEWALKKVKDIKLEKAHAK